MPAGKWTFDNPVIAKELRGRMRGPRAYWMLLGYLLLLSVAMLLSYYAWWRDHASALQTGSIAGSFTAGREFYMILFVVQACLVALIAPALTSGAISIEREQRTLPPIDTHAKIFHLGRERYDHRTKRKKKPRD